MNNKKVQIPHEMIVKLLQTIRNNDEVENDARVYFQALKGDTENLTDKQKDELTRLVNLYNATSLFTSQKLTEHVLSSMKDLITESDAINHGKSSTLGNIYTIISDLYLKMIPHYDQEKILRKELYKSVEDINKVYLKNKNKKMSDIKMSDTINTLTKNLYSYFHNEKIVLSPVENEIMNIIRPKYEALINSKQLTQKDVIDKINVLYRSMGEDYNPELSSLSKNILNEKFENDKFVLKRQDLPDKTLDSLNNVKEFLRAEKVDYSYSNNLENETSYRKIVLGQRARIDGEAEVQTQNARMNDIINLLYSYNMMQIENEIADKKEFNQVVHRYATNKDKMKYNSLRIADEQILKTAKTYDYSSKYENVKSLVSLLASLQMAKYLVVDKSDYLAIEKALTGYICDKLLSITSENTKVLEYNIKLNNVINKLNNNELSLEDSNKQLQTLKTEISSVSTGVDEFDNLEKKAQYISLLLSNNTISSKQLQDLNNVSDIGIMNSKSLKTDITMLYAIDKYIRMSNDFLVDYAKLINKKSVTLNSEVPYPDKQINLMQDKAEYLGLLKKIAKSNGLDNSYLQYASLSESATSVERSENQVYYTYNVNVRQDGVYEGLLGDLVDVVNVNSNINTDMTSIVDSVINKQGTDFFQKIATNIGTDNFKELVSTSQKISDSMSKIRSRVLQSHICATEQTLKTLKNKNNQVDSLIKFIEDCPTRTVDLDKISINLKNPINNAKISIGQTLGQSLETTMTDYFDNQLGKYDDIDKKDYAKYGSALKEIYAQSYNRNEKMELTDREKLYKKLVIKIKNANTSIQKSISEVLLRNEKGVDFIESEVFLSAKSRIYAETKKEILNKDLKNAQTDDEKYMIQGKLKELESSIYRYTKLKSKMNEIVANFLTNEVGLKNITTENAINNLESYLLVKVSASNLVEGLDSGNDKIVFAKTFNSIKMFEEKFDAYCDSYNLNIEEKDIDRNVVSNVENNSSSINEINNYLNEEQQKKQEEEKKEIQQELVTEAV